MARYDIKVNLSVDGTISASAISVASITAGNLMKAGVSTIGNTSGITGTVPNQVVFAGGNNVTLSQSTNATGATITISGAAGAFSAGMSTGGNTSGTTGLVSSQIVFVGGNSITLSQSTDVGGATLTISGATTFQSVQTQNVIADIVISGNTSGVTADITSGTMTLVGGNNITLSQVGNSVVVSGAVISPQTNQTVGLYGSGNTSGTSTGTADARSLSIQVQGSLTVDMTNGLINLSAPNAITTAMASNRGSDFVQAAAGFNGTNASGTIASNAISVSVAAQTAQSMGIYGSSQTVGQSSSSTVDARSLTVRGMGIASVGMSAGELLISVPSDVGDGGNVLAAGTQTANTTGTVLFSNSNGISFGMSNSSVITASHNGITSQTDQTVGLYGSGNTSGTSTGTVDARSLTFRAQGSLTVDMTNGVINLSAPNALTTAMASNRGSDFVQAAAGFNGTNASGTIASNAISVSVDAQSAQTVGIYGSGNTSGTSTGTVDARSLTFRAQGSLTVDMTNGIVNLSAPNALTTAMASNRGSDFVQAAAGFNGTNASGTIASNAISVSVDAQSNQTAGLYGSGNTSGTSTGTIDMRSFTVNAQGSLTVDMTNGKLNISAPNAITTAMASNRGSDFVAATAGFNGTNASGTLASNSWSVSVAAQTAQSIGLYGSGNTSGTSTGTLDARSLTINAQGSLTVDMTNGMINISAPNAITTAMASNRGSDFVQATAGFNGTNASGTIASNSWSVSVAAQTAQTVGLYGSSNTSGTSTATVDARSLSFQAAGPISVNMTNGVVFLSAPNTIAQSNQSVGIYGSGNTSGTSTGTLDARSLTINAQGSLTVDMTNGVINLSAPNAITTAMASNRGSDFVQAAAGFNGTNASGTIASNAISVSVVAQTNQSVGLYASSNTYLTSSGTVDARSLSFRGDKSITVGISASEVVFSVGAYITTADLSQNSSKYAGINGAITGGSITVNTSGVSVNISTQTNQTVGIYASSNTSGTSTGTLDARSMTFQAYGGVSVDMTNGKVNISGITQSVQTQNFNANVIGGNTTGTTASITSGTMTIAGGNNITISQAGGQEITISQQNQPASMWPIVPVSSAMSSTLYSGSAGAGGGSTATTVSGWVWPVVFPNPLVFNEIVVPVFMSATSTNTSANWSYTQGATLGIYTKNAGSLSLIETFTNRIHFSHASTNTSGSGSASFHMSWGGSDTNGSSAMTIATSTATAAGYWTGISGSKIIPFRTGTSATQYSEGQYFLMMAISYSTGSSDHYAFSQVGQIATAQMNTMQRVGLTATASTSNAWPLLGLASFTLNSNSSHGAASLATSAISQTTNNATLLNAMPAVTFLNRST